MTLYDDIAKRGGRGDHVEGGPQPHQGEDEGGEGAPRRRDERPHLLRPPLVRLRRRHLLVGAPRSSSSPAPRRRSRRCSPTCPQTESTPELRVDCPEEKKFEVVRRAQEFFAARYEAVTVDGVRVVFPDGWGLVRASNTQPLLVLRFEAKTRERLDEIERARARQGARSSLRGGGGRRRCALAIGVDLGGTNARAAVVDARHGRDRRRAQGAARATARRRRVVEVVAPRGRARRRAAAGVADGGVRRGGGRRRRPVPRRDRRRAERAEPRLARRRRSASCSRDALGARRCGSRTTSRSRRGARSGSARRKGHRRRGARVRRLRRRLRAHPRRAGSTTARRASRASSAT